jgi:hypothetical protein
MKKNSTQTIFLKLIILLLLPVAAMGQDDLMSELEIETSDTTANLANATFKGSRLINGHSVEMRSGGVLEFLISHRFGRLNEGAYNLFGLDDSNIRLGLEYGISDRVNIGIGRSSFLKMYDGFFKYKLLHQQTGKKNIPLSLVAFTNITINTLKPAEGDKVNFSRRLQYTYQLLLARKFNSNFSLQLMPTLVHRNIVVAARDANDLWALGAGGRYKLSGSVAFNIEYYYQVNPDENNPYNALSIGFDIETGGHVFQLHLTNARAMVEPVFVGATTGNFWDGDIHFGFNISRVFDL